MDTPDDLPLRAVIQPHQPKQSHQPPRQSHLMLNDLTAAKLDHGLAKLALEQLMGGGPQPGEVSGQYLATLSGLSPATVHRYERMLLAKFAGRLLADPDLPPHIARRLAAALSPASSPADP